MKRPGKSTELGAVLKSCRTHIILAAAIVPMALVTLSRGLGRRYDAHRRIARWTLPVWLYVSVTGVAVYLMLYRMY